MIKILIVDDHEIFRQGLKLVLYRIEDIDIVKEAGGGLECIEILQTWEPDLVFMDVKMPGCNGMETTQIIHRNHPKIKVVALSMFGEEEYLQGMLEAGACGFILKDIDRMELIFAIQKIMRGQSYFSAQLLPYFTNKFLDDPNQNNEIGLTQREIDVLQEIALGKSSQEIADSLFISKRTVEGHKAHLIAKTESKNVLSLLLFAIKNNLVELK